MTAYPGVPGWEWPATVLFDETATVLRFAFDSKSASLLLSETRGLYSWQQPELPEDLCLLTNDGKPWLVTISHERDAYLDIPSKDVADVLTNLNSIKLLPEDVVSIES